MSHYLSQSLIFEQDRIYFINARGYEYQVMMSWEDDLMREHANYVCTNGGDILEIGFGMGISAGYIQANNPNSHTIIENHPDIIPKALEWAADKPNVTIVQKSWYDALPELTTYDGVFFDTYGDRDLFRFEEALPGLVKPGGLATWWNIKDSAESIFNFDGITYQEIAITPPENSYFNSSVYYLPKKQF